MKKIQSLKLSAFPFSNCEIIDITSPDLAGGIDQLFSAMVNAGDEIPIFPPSRPTVAASAADIAIGAGSIDATDGVYNLFFDDSLLPIKLTAFYVTVQPRLLDHVESMRFLLHRYDGKGVITDTQEYLVKFLGAVNEVSNFVIVTYDHARTDAVAGDIAFATPSGPVNVTGGLLSFRKGASAVLSPWSFSPTNGGRGAILVAKGATQFPNTTIRMQPLMFHPNTVSTISGMLNEAQGWS